MADLQILLALIDGGQRWWDAGDLGIRAGTDPVTARRALEEFAGQNLLDIRISDAVKYRLHPGSEVLARALDQLAAAYRTSPTAVVDFVAGMCRAVVQADDDRFKR